MEKLLKELEKEFEMTADDPSSLLGIKLIDDETCLKISQGENTVSTLEKCNTTL